MTSLLTRAAVAITVTIIALPLPAQGRVVDLTGRPAATLEEPFTTIAGVREVAPNVVIMSDMQERRLVRSDLRTGEVREIGRQGDGPGEWRLPVNVFPGAGRDTYVPDLMQAKIHVVSPEGEITRSVPMTSTDDGGMSILIPQGVDAAGRLYYTGPPITESGEQMDSIPILRRKFVDGGGTPETMAMLPNPIQMLTSSSGGARVTMGRLGPYQARDRWTVLPDGRVAIVRAKPYHVEIHAAGRRPIIGPTVAYTPVKVGKAERDAYRERMKNATGMMITRGTGSGGGGVSAQTVGVGGSDMPDSDFPEVMPAFEGTSDLAVAPNGEIWVRRAAAANARERSYDIFSPATGQRVGTARLGPDSRVVGFGTGSIYVVRQDPADDLLYLERYAS